MILRVYARTRGSYCSAELMGDPPETTDQSRIRIPWYDDHIPMGQGFLALLGGVVAFVGLAQIVDNPFLKLLSLLLALAVCVSCYFYLQHWGRKYAVAAETWRRRFPNLSLIDDSIREIYRAFGASCLKSFTNNVSLGSAADMALL